MDMTIRPVFKTSRNHPMHPISIGALSKWMIATIIVMIFVREIEIVLVHRERDAPFRRLDEHLRVVLRIGPEISAARSVRLGSTINQARIALWNCTLWQCIKSLRRLVILAPLVHPSLQTLGSDTDIVIGAPAHAFPRG